MAIVSHGGNKTHTLWQATCISQARRDNQMLYWALTFFVVALIAAILGFGGVAIAAASIAKVLFFVFLVLFLFSLVAHMSRRV
jgi:uncharacterized membrane protein YtjA (UPF0391 family)